MTLAYAFWVLLVHTLAWGFCLCVGAHLGLAWGIAAFVLMELRALKSAQSAMRYMRERGL